MQEARQRARLPARTTCSSIEVGWFPVAGEIVLVLAFVTLGGAFAAAEIALVSLRPGQVTRLAASGGRRGAMVQRLLQQPNRFLSASQIGVTLAGFLSSAVGAVTFSHPVATQLHRLGLPPGAADTLSVLLVTVVVAYVSLVIGELAPKRLGLQHAESIALVAAGTLEAIAKGTRPVIWLLGVSSDLVVRLAGGDPTKGRTVMSEEELRDMLATNEHLSVDERRVIAQVMNAGERPVREIMVPRLDVSALQADLTVAQALEVVRGKPFSRYPVVDGGLDDAIGFVHVRDLYSRPAEVSPGSPLRPLVRPMMRIPDSRRALPALAEMRRAGSHLALVVDEYGGGAGVIALEDLLEELVGDITDEFDPRHGHGAERSQPDGVARPLPAEPVDAQLRLEEFEEETGVRLPDGPYDTAAGWMLHTLGRIPNEGDQARSGDILLTVTQMRARRVERVRLDRSPVSQSGPAVAAALPPLAPER
jgi:putative hemolysin